MNAEERASEVTNLVFELPKTRKPIEVYDIVLKHLNAHGESEYQNGDKDGYQRGLKDMEKRLSKIMERMPGTNEYGRGKHDGVLLARTDVRALMEVKS